MSSFYVQCAISRRGPKIVNCTNYTTYAPKDGDFVILRGPKTFLIGCVLGTSENAGSISSNNLAPYEVVAQLQTVPFPPYSKDEHESQCTAQCGVHKAPLSLD